MEAIQFKTLFEQVNSLNNHYKRLSDLTGENFNIFRILKLESSEVRLHSTFLAELLNPKGNHGQKDAFLKLFVDLFCFKKNSIETESCEVKIEKHTGFINEDQTEGGRIDIIITDKNGHQILIENKIYAADQKNQLLRYHNYSRDADLIYITLDKKIPDKNSYSSLILDEHFKCYSYKTDVLEWLELCRKEVAVYPIVRESITQYINLIKYLTNQTINDTMQEELGNLMKSNLEASFLVADNLDTALKKVFDNFSSDLKSFCDDLNLKFEHRNDFKKSSNFFKIYREEWQYVKIEFLFENYSKGMLYGFTCKNDLTKNIVPVALKEKLNTYANKTISANQEWWLLYDKFDKPYNDWSKFEAWEAVIDGTMMEIIKKSILSLLEITKEVKL